MDELVIVALAFGVVSLGGAGVAAVALWRAVGDLRSASAAAGERITPLTDELAAEQAVTALELEALQRTTARRSSAPRHRA